MPSDLSILGTVLIVETIISNILHNIFSVIFWKPFLLHHTHRSLQCLFYIHYDLVCVGYEGYVKHFRSSVQCETVSEMFGDRYRCLTSYYSIYANIIEEDSLRRSRLRTAFHEEG